MTPRGSIELRCGRITKFRGQIRSVDNRVALYKAEVTFKVNYFLLVNAVNLCEQFEPVATSAWENISPQVESIPIEMTEFRVQKFTEQW